jgi:hypothetical protein
MVENVRETYALPFRFILTFTENLRVATGTMWADNCQRIVHYYLTLRSGLTINTAANYTQHGERMCWHTYDLNTTRQAHVPAHV